MDEVTLVQSHDDVVRVPITVPQKMIDAAEARQLRVRMVDTLIPETALNAPAGSTIEVVFDGFMLGLGSNGCPYGGAEIKTGSDKRNTGYRFCGSESAGTSLISTHNIVPIIISTTLDNATTVLRYRIGNLHLKE
ncbi:hypothetical protein KIN20_033005 [Parelaphostrongylus tenuis]|uniref:Uncharacterized protein n=1 Tax=Parelaphostrongylus tenuis TaxID=148309 RepID=A0AAD5WII6_PARTN|nr:hypothetical protein KIN20_033005 [Parelaphostrongylus tenuis]